MKHRILVCLASSSSMNVLRRNFWPISLVDERERGTLLTGLIRDATYQQTPGMRTTTCSPSVLVLCLWIAFSLQPFTSAWVATRIATYSRVESFTTPTRFGGCPTSKLLTTVPQTCSPLFMKRERSPKIKQYQRQEQVVPQPEKGSIALQVFVRETNGSSKVSEAVLIAVCIESL